MMAMANPMGRIEPMTEPEAEPMANSTMSAEDQAAMAPLEDLLPTLLQIFLTVRLCKTMLKKSNLKAGWSRLGCGLPSSAWPKRSKRVGNLCRQVCSIIICVTLFIIPINIITNVTTSIVIKTKS